MSYDSSDPKQVNARKRKAKLDDKSFKDVVRGVISTREGRLWAFHFLERCHMFHTSFSTSGLALAFNEGERNIGLEFQAGLIAADPRLYLKMLEERQEESEDGNRTDPESDAD